MDDTGRRAIAAKALEMAAKAACSACASGLTATEDGFHTWAAREWWQCTARDVHRIAPEQVLEAVEKKG
jgi:hypothetical protein